MINWLLHIINSIPHFTFGLKSIEAEFSLDWKSDYAQSLALIAVFIGIIALLLLLTITITWICQCCTNDDIAGKSRRQVLRLSRILFVLSLICFILLGVCLFANECINRGVQSSINGISDVNRQFRLAVSQSSTLNTTCLNGTNHVHNLEELVHSKSKEPGVNQTLVGEIDVLLTNITDRLDLVTDILNKMNQVFGEVKFFESAHIKAQMYETERWLTVLVLLVIMIGVFFAGLLSFCRRSKSIAVGFSGAGMVIFIVTWLLLCIVTASTVALADFCTRGDKFIQQNIGKPMIDTMVFYNQCDEHPTHDNIPSSLQAANISNLLSDIQVSKSKLDSLLDQTFNHSEIISNTSAIFNLDATASLKQIGALESAVACYAFRTDVRAMHYGICEQSLIGSVLMTLCLFFLGFFLFIVLVIVSKSWKLFSRLPSDYVEVDEDDPFFPRGNDSNIPVDIYGTHVFNPRTRERTEPSTNTTIATANGHDSDETAFHLLRHSQQPSMGGNYTDQPYGNFQSRYDV